MKRLFHVCVAVWVACVVVSLSGRHAIADERPNILFILTDDHATKAISAYDSSLVKTPNIDRIAAEGMLFRNCFVTNSICGPSRAVILTGKHSHLNGKKTNSPPVPFDGAQETFPKLLKQAGYQTAVIGKWHLDSTPTGFDHWNVLPGQGSYYQPDFLTPNGKISVPGYVTDVIADMSQKWLEERDKTKPFLLLCHHKAPHMDLVPAVRHLALFNDKQLPEPENLLEDFGNRGRHGEMAGIRLGRCLTYSGSFKLPPALSPDPKNTGAKRFNQWHSRLTPEERAAFDQAYAGDNEAFAREKLKGDELLRWKYQRIVKDYLRTIVAVDESVGKLLQYLDTSGLADNTIVIFASDQGFFLGEHGLFNKRFMYEESLRMPLLIRWPKRIQPGATSAHLVQNLDLAPTLMEIAGIDVAGDVQGRSLVPILKGESPGAWREAIYYHYYESDTSFSVPKHCGVRTDRYKLIHYYTLDEWELFDLKHDSAEMHNLYGKPEYEAVQQELQTTLRELQKTYRDDTAK